jgi:hypothetical protein
MDAIVTDAVTGEVLSMARCTVEGVANPLAGLANVRSPQIRIDSLFDLADGNVMVLRVVRAPACQPQGRHG